MVQISAVTWAFEHFFPEAQKSVVEISVEAIKILEKQFPALTIQNSSIVGCNLNEGAFDMSVVMGVLIHIHPSDLLANIQKVIDSSNRYIVVGEYFNRTPIELEYQGSRNKLFKCDFGKFILENSTT